MTQRNDPGIPPGLIGEHALLWAIAHRAKLDATYTPRRGTQRPEVSEADRQSAIEFLQQLRDDLQAVCA